MVKIDNLNVNKGYVLIYRKVLSNKVVMKDYNHLALWIELILNANFDDNNGLSRGQVRIDSTDNDTMNIIKDFCDAEMLVEVSKGVFSINKYDSYQAGGVANAGGYVLIYRKVLDNPAITKSKKNEALWFYILLTVNWGEAQILFKGRQRKIRPGQHSYGTKQMSVALDIPQSTVYRILDKFVQYELITKVADNSCTLITLPNWDAYQNKKIEDGKNKNVPTKEEVRIFFKEQGLASNYNDFYCQMADQEWKDAKGSLIANWQKFAIGFDRKKQSIANGNNSNKKNDFIKYCMEEEKNDQDRS